ncbi:MAG: hypothetical protein ACK500_10080, partial [Flavobacteriales bacterium]
QELSAKQPRRISVRLISWVKGFFESKKKGIPNQLTLDIRRDLAEIRWKTKIKLIRFVKDRSIQASYLHN